MSFSQEQIEAWSDAADAIPAKTQRLVEQFLAYSYSNAKAREYATQGFSRRIYTLARCIRNVFEVIPLAPVVRPTADERKDAEINIQAFLFNTFGSIDNLAWILICEKGLVRNNGKEFTASQIGLGPKNEQLREVVSLEFSSYLATRDEWFDYLADYRHALAHRIPIYIPPYTVTEAQRAEHNRLEDEKAQAIRQQNFERANQLDDVQDALGTFTPIMDHSPIESPGSIAFHREMLVDFHTVEEIAENVLEELAR